MYVCLPSMPKDRKIDDTLTGAKDLLNAVIN